MSIRFCTDAAQWLQQFEQADIVAATALHDGEGVDGYGRVDGDMLLFYRGGGGSCGEEREAGEQDRKNRGSQFPVLSSQYPTSHWELRTGN
jgi:hypothetical protein